ncbi:hypothetical protein G4228_011828 [Cervus hanglu yarkandensis]|nr:hypothetical protein G4228_011828 [Cervus hanglu yarkandensis]
MVGQTRNKLRGAASEPSHSLRSTQSRRRRRATGAGEPELEEEPKEEVKRPEPPLPTRRGNLPGGAREYSPRRIRNLKTQNCVPVEMVTRTDLLNGRFQFLRAFLEQLWDKAQLLQRRQVSGKGAFGIAAFVAILHWVHLITLFENDRHFSHLSALEREMTFRTEMIASLFPMYVVGYIEPNKFQKIIHANMISVFLCFVFMFGNPMYLSSYYSSSLLITLVIQGSAWFCGTIVVKFLTSKILGVSDHIRLSDLIAARILRYTDFDTLIYTCAPEFDFMEKAGLYYSYFKTIVEAPSFLNGVWMIMNDKLTEYPLVINTLKRFNLYPECTRVMWTPPLRESFSYPFLVLQMLLVTHILRATKLYRGSLIALCISNVFFMLPWQFAQFVLLTQIASLFALYVVGYIDISKLRKIIYMHMVIQGCFWLFGTVILKYLTSKIFGIADDAHIGNLLTSKFFSYKDFDTLLYTCAAEFDFMEKEVISDMWVVLTKQQTHIRARTKIVYSMYSRKAAEEVKRELIKLQVNYYILEESWCIRRSKPGCSMPEIWDVEDPANAGKPPLCNLLVKESKPHFTTVFQNSVYKVLEVIEE